METVEAAVSFGASSVRGMPQVRTDTGGSGGTPREADTVRTVGGDDETAGLRPDKPPGPVP